MNDFIVITDRQGHQLLGISRAYLERCASYDVDFEICGEAVFYTSWGFTIDEWPIDEEMRYRWRYLEDVANLQRNVNTLRAMVAAAEQEYLNEFARSIDYFI